MKENALTQLATEPALHLENRATDFGCFLILIEKGFKVKSLQISSEQGVIANAYSNCSRF